MKKIDADAFQRIFEYASDIISIHDMDGTFLDVSPACKELLGYTQEELTGLSPYELFHPEDHEKVFKSYASIKEPPHIHKVDYRIKHRNGGYIWFESTSSLMKEDGTARIVSFTRDITRRKQTEQALERALEAREQLLAILSHDLRNSFQALQVFSLLLSEDLEELREEEIRTYSQEIHISTIRVNELLNNMITWSKSHRDELACEPTDIALQSVLDSVQELYKNQIAKKDIEISIQLDEPGTVYADPDMCKSIFRNLISNAIKFSKESGTIRVEHRREEEATTVRIMDRGVGMSPSKAEQLFRGPNESEAGTMGEVGTGIGLSLCQNFVHRHDGRIWADSAPGEGTTVTVELPNNGNRMRGG